MDRVKEPVTFKDLVEADLRRAARLVIKNQDEIDPQFRIATPEGDYWVAVQLPPGESERQTILRHTTHHLIVAHEVTNVGAGRSQLANMAQAAKAALHTDKLEAVAGDTDGRPTLRRG